MRRAVTEWLAYLSHRWPHITHETIMTMPIEWLCYYVQAARGIIEQERAASASMSGR